LTKIFCILFLNLFQF